MTHTTTTTTDRIAELELKVAELEADKAQLNRVWQEAEAALVRAWANAGADRERLTEELAVANAATSAVIDANNANLAALAAERKARREAEDEAARLKAKLAAIASYAGDE